MNFLEIKRAEDIDAMLNTFAPHPLNANLPESFYYGQTMTIRTGDEWDSPLINLFMACSTPSSANAHLLLGHRGCGKSTELYKLKQKFEESGQPVKIVDTIGDANLGELDHWDIMLLITESLCHIADTKNISLPEHTVNAIFDYLIKDKEEITQSEFSDSTGISAGARAATPPILSSVIKLFAEIKYDRKSSEFARVTVTKRMERRASEWFAYIKEISDLIASGCDNRQPVIIFEDLDKSPNPEKTIDVFQYSILAQMPFPIIYTFPISQFYSHRFASIRDLYTHHILPMIKVSNVDGSKNLEGINVMHEIVSLRARLELFDDDILDNLIVQTGGSLRDLFVCIIMAARRASRRGVTRIELEDAERALSELTYELTARIDQGDYGELAKIYNNPKIKRQIPEGDFLLRMMHSLAVLEYRNGDRWHDLHPLVAKFLLDQGVLK